MIDMATTKTNSPEGYNGPYLERSGKDSLVLAETLLKPSEFILNESEKQEVRGFEDFICGRAVDSGMTIEQLFLAHKGETTTAPRFFAEAFIKDNVKIPESIVDIPEFLSSEDVYMWLAASARDSKIDGVSMRNMAKQSVNYYKQVTAKALLEGTKPDDSTMDNMSIVFNPTELVKMSQSVVQAREFIHGLHRDLHEGGDRLVGAKRAITDVYLGKINTVVVNDITTLDYLVEQSKLIGDDETAKAATEVIPPVIYNALCSKEQGTIKRLDYIRNGIGLDTDGRATSVDEDVIENNVVDKSEFLTEAPLFTLEQREKLKSFKLSPQEMAGFYSRILEKAGLLSSEDSSTWSPKRSHRAADELFQVVVNPNASNFSIDGISGVYKVASEERSLFDAIVVGGFHELEHVNQTQIDRELGKNLKIVELKGRRSSMFREGGANFKQRQAEMALFGDCKPIALAYARALKTLELGGDIFDASQAFFGEKKLSAPDSSPADLAKEAADRVLRLKLHGGFNSQPMAYAEEVLLDQELKGAQPELKDRAMAVTSIDLVDQVRLHRYGLIDLPEHLGIDWTEIIMREAEPYIQQALAKE